MKKNNIIKPVFISSFIENGLFQVKGIETHPAQRHSKMSNLKVDSENSSAQRDSGIYNLSMGHIGPIGLMGRKPVMKNSSAQRDSIMSNLRRCPINPLCPTSPLSLENASAQQHSKMSNLKLESENSSAQPDSGISKLGMGLMGVIGVMGVMGLMGREHKSKNCPAQQDSGISTLKTSPYRPLAVRLVPLCGDPFRPLDFKTTPGQPDSPANAGSILKTSPYCPLCPLVFKTAPAQPDSKISKFIKES